MHCVFVVNRVLPYQTGTRDAGVVVRGSTSLPLWKCDGRKSGWKEFDIAAFKESLKVYNQFQQNVEKREDKLDSFAARLLIIDGERAMESYTSDAGLLGRLEKVWQDSKGKPKAPANDSGEELSLPRFTEDARIHGLDHQR